MSRARVAALALLALVGGCGPSTRSSMTLERRPRPLAVDGPDMIALPISDRFRYGVVLGSVVTVDGARGCNGGLNCCLAATSSGSAASATSRCGERSWYGWGRSGGR